jgi:hypothetical protein
MTSKTPRSFSQPFQAERPHLDPLADERTALVGFLEWHRATLRAKVADLGQEQLDSRSVDPSGLSLHGLVRHLAGVERWWFQINFSGRDVPMLHYTEDDPDLDFEGTDAPFADDLATWESEVEESRRIVEEAPSLDITFTRRRDGESANLRWLLLHLVTEYARHNGHADLLRERIDGVTGY